MQTVLSFHLVDCHIFFVKVWPNAQWPAFSTPEIPLFGGTLYIRPSQQTMACILYAQWFVIHQIEYHSHEKHIVFWVHYSDESPNTRFLVTVFGSICNIVAIRRIDILDASIILIMWLSDLFFAISRCLDSHLTLVFRTNDIENDPLFSNLIFVYTTQIGVVFDACNNECAENTCMLIDESSLACAPRMNVKFTSLHSLKYWISSRFELISVFSADYLRISNILVHQLEKFYTVIGFTLFS